VRHKTYPVLPKHIQLGVGHHDTIKQTENNQEAGQDVADDGEARRPRADPLPPAGLKEEKQQRHEEHIARRRRVVRQASGEIPQQPVQSTRQQRPGNLAEHLGGAEGDPAVDARGVLAGLPQGAVGVELGQYRVEHGRGDHDDEEGREHGVLHVGGRVAQLPKGEAVEDAHDDGREEAAVDVGRVAPLAGEHALGQEEDLGGDGGGEFVGGGLGFGRRRSVLAAALGF